MSNSCINEILWTKHELISASKGKDLTTKFLNNKKITGPLERFKVLLNSDSYKMLLNHVDHNIIEVKNKRAHSGILRYKKTQDSSAHLLLP